MNFAKLSQNEKLAVYGSAAVIIGGLIGIGAAGLGIVAVLAAVGMLAVIFLPQMSPGTNLPGSKGSLMLLLGGVAAVILVLGFLSVLGALGALFRFAAFNTLFYLLAIAGGILMAWAGWREFQSEGGKFQVGTAPSSAGTAQPPPSVESSSERPSDAATVHPADHPTDAAPHAEAPVDRDREDRPSV